jgi:dTDP-4-amino-4,6-dideoxygalactose transaminase
MKKKHAYLLMAHINPWQLSVLLELLDDERNDIFLFIDAKSNLTVDQLNYIPKKSKFILANEESKQLYWGGISEMLSELTLFERALAEDQYHYLHTLSGLDLPLKTQDEIHAFFDNTQLEYVSFDERNFIMADWKTKYYHFFVEGFDYRGFMPYRILRVGLMLAQKWLGFSRKREFDTYYHGSSWISITQQFAEHLLAKKKALIKTYQYTICSAEVFIQTELKHSSFKGNEIEIDFPDSQNMRLIDWERHEGNSPYTWKMSDWEYMKSSPFLFARKIDERIDKELILTIKNHLAPKIWLSSPHMGTQELGYIQQAFASNWVAPLGPWVNLLEEKLATYSGLAHAAALSSGTSAIHLALILAGVEQGDVVLCQTFTFSASANPIIYQKAIPVFIDSELDTWNMCPIALEKAILHYISLHKKPKAIIPVHLYGMPANMPEIMRIAREYDIPVIEDAAEALGSRIQDKACGSFGDYGIYSFNGNKIITTSGGGALLSNKKEVIDKARFLATQARDAAPHYEHSHIGYNYRMSNISAGIGVGQMDVLEDRVKARRANFEKYRNLFEPINRQGFHIDFQLEPRGYFSNRWLSCIVIDPLKNQGITAEHIRLSLEKNRIETRPVWKPMHQQPIFQDAPRFLTGVSDHLFQQGLCLPSGSNLTDDDWTRIESALNQVFC